MTANLWQYLVAPRQLPSPEDRYSGVLLLLFVLLYSFILVMWVIEHRGEVFLWFPPALGIWLIGIHRLFWKSKNSGQTLHKLGQFVVTILLGILSFLLCLMDMISLVGLFQFLSGNYPGGSALLSLFFLFLMGLWLLVIHWLIWAKRTSTWKRPTIGEFAVTGCIGLLSFWPCIGNLLMMFTMAWEFS